MKWGELFREARKAGRLTQPEASRLVDVSTQTVSNWECLRSEPWASQQDTILAKVRGAAVAVEPLAEPAGRDRRRISDLI